MKKTSILITMILACFFFSCDKSTDPIEAKEFNFDFQSSSENWVGDFADYTDHPDVAGFHFSHSTLPSPLNTSDGALKQSGHNGFDDLFMFGKRKITGLERNKVYTVSIEMEIASDAPNWKIHTN